MGNTSHRTLWYTLFALLVLIMSWETNLNAAALVTPAIPEEAIRIRILANSDSPQDQWIKKQVREAVSAEVNGWGLSGARIEEARHMIETHLPKLEQVVGETLARYGFRYGYRVELGQVEFPAKQFEGTMYPAGEYEALRITLGDGLGENWWCVLFPPLCFGGGTVKAKESEAETPDNPGEKEPESPADSGAGAKAAKKSDSGRDRTADNEKTQNESDHTGQDAHRATAKSGQTSKHTETDGQKDHHTADGNVREQAAAWTADAPEEDVEFRSFFADLFKKAAGKIKGLFA